MHPMFFLLLTLTPFLGADADVPSPPVHILTIGQNQTIIAMTSLAESRYIFESKTAYTLNLAVHNNEAAFSSCSLFKGDTPENGAVLMGLDSLSNGTVYSFNYTTTLLCSGSSYPEAYLMAAPLSDDLSPSSQWFVRLGLPLSIVLQSTGDSPSYLTTYCPDGCVEYLQSVDSDETEGTFSILTGIPGNLFDLTSFPVNNSNYSLPQQVRGTLRTYRLVDGTVSLYIDGDNSTWTAITCEREGFFMSAEYPSIGLEQTAATLFTSEDLMLFTFSIEEMHVGGDGNFTALIDYEENKSYSMFLQSDLTTSYSIDPQKGYSMSLALKQGSQTSKGGLVRFQIVSHSTGLSCLLVICPPIVFLLYT